MASPVSLLLLLFNIFHVCWAFAVFVFGPTSFLAVTVTYLKIMIVIQNHFVALKFNYSKRNERKQILLLLLFLYLTLWNISCDFFFFFKYNNSP